MRVFRWTMGLSMIAAGCGGGGDGYGPGGGGPTGGNPQANATVTTPSLAFSPARVNLLRDGTVTWTFGATEHSVIFDAVTGAPSNVAPCGNCSTAKDFPTAGTFTYHCGVHPQMAGTVAVE